MCEICRLKKKNRILWYLKQLFPLTYRSHYKTKSGKPHFAVWKMWFGRCYKIEDFEIVR